MNRGFKRRSGFVTRSLLSDQEIGRIKPIYVSPKIGRNQKCDCESGKKFKHCCMPT